MTVRANPEVFAAEPTTIGDVAVKRPQTGQEYLESLDDGREVFLYGEKVKDVTSASRLPQHRAHGGPPLRRAARRQAQSTRSCCRPKPAMAA